jgi:FkbM family methyltransferase
MKEIDIHNKKYTVDENEFNIMEVNLNPMVIRADVSDCDRDIGLLKKLSSSLRLNELFCSKVKFGGYVPINLIDSFSVINISRDSSIVNIRKNLEIHDCKQMINIISYTNTKDIEYELSFENEIGIIISKTDTNMSSMYKLSYFEKYVYVSNLIWTDFCNKFNYWLKKTEDNRYIFEYDNLINLLIMVKNGGDVFRDILVANKPYIDRWTILDTGSTDNTIEIINDVLSDKEGILYQEPFINFKDSRNRLLELAGSECAFNLMLDDTYFVTGNLRDFLSTARGDDVADSFSLFITDPETQYSSNRITKPERRLRYKYKVHEIIEKNQNLCIPIDISRITDVVCEYMKVRTMDRKQRDLDFLFEELSENPEDPRSLYYLAETFFCIKDWTNAFKYYKLRSEIVYKGFEEEMYDSYFKMALLSERHMNVPWDDVEAMYMNCYDKDKEIPDPLFMIGYHYLLENNDEKAYSFLKRVMTIPRVHKNMNVRAIIRDEYSPKFLLGLSFKFEDYELGLFCSQILLNNFKNNFTYKKWGDVFSLYIKLEKEKLNVNLEIPKLKNDSKVICFIDNGGWSSWDGETLNTKGLGGSETWTIQYAETLALNKNNNVIVFCNCNETNLEVHKVYNNVTYIPIEKFGNFALINVIDVCLVSRYTEYVLLCISRSFSITKLYLVLHDIAIEGDLIPMSNNLTGILCISEWQKQQFLSFFPALQNKTSVISYGIETEDYGDIQVENKKKYSFIYPSFPNRGLLYLLRMFPKIVERYPESKLNVFCNLDLAYLHYAKEEIDEIRRLLVQQSETVTNHGWVNKDTLNRYWSESHIWFYPCTFSETCCRVAMEAASSKTFVLCNDLAALNETVGKRGAIISGDPKTEEWQNNALRSLFFVIDNELENIFIQRNHEWAKTKSYSTVVSDFENRFLSIENEGVNDFELINESKDEDSFYSEDPVEKLRYIHSQLKLDYGSFDEEYPEQIMVCKFITGNENILEIGGNVGRNSLVIAYILSRNNNSNLVTMESNPLFAKQLEHNKNQNNLNFYIEPFALSKRKLIQKENDCKTFVANVIPTGYLSVNTMNWKVLCKKYSFIFDTIVFDCEGAFYYILRDMPEVLTNIKKIIMENDYLDLSHKRYIDNVLEENGFSIVYSKSGGDNVFAPCKEYFYQVWTRT